MNETTADIDAGKLTDVEWGIVMLPSVVLAGFALVNVVELLRANRTIGNAYMAATDRPRRYRIRRQHENLRKHLVRVITVTFTFAGLCGFASLYGTTFRSFPDLESFFFLLTFSSCLFNFLVLIVSGVMLTDLADSLSDLP